MSDFSFFTDRIESKLATIPGLRIYDYRVDREPSQFPCAYIFDWDLSATYQPLRDDAVYFATVRLLVAHKDPREAQRALADYISAESTNVLSVRYAIDSPPGFGHAYLAVANAGPRRRFQYGKNDYWGVEFVIEGRADTVTTPKAVLSLDGVNLLRVD